PRPVGKERVAQALRRQGTELFLITNGKADQVGLPPWVVRQVSAGQPGTGLVLTQRAASGVGISVLSRLWLALLAGLLAGGLAGVLLARRLAGPIRHAAAAAARLSAGDRSVRVAPQPPA